MKVFHVIPHAGYCGINRELDLLLNSPSSAPQDVRVCCLAGDGPVTRRWRALDMNVEALNWQRVIDLRPAWTLVGQLREWRPDVIHAWGLASLRAVRLAARQTSAAIVVRKPLPSERRPRQSSGLNLLSRWERWLLASADLLLASTDAEAARCVKAGLSAAALRVVPSGVQIRPAGKTAENPRIVCAGALQAHKGFYEAIWAFDILQFVNDTVVLIIVGDGPQRRRLEQFAGNMGHGSRIQIVGEVGETDPLLTQAALVWAPSLTDSGAGVVLEAMAAGLPVVASRWPGLVEIVADGETGVLVAPGDKVDLARQTRRLLDDRPLRLRLGEAARCRAERFFSPDRFVDSWNQAINNVRSPKSDVRCLQA
jgi:glycosyltransferase involved in cell wall biosynthesis